MIGEMVKFKDYCDEVYISKVVGIFSDKHENVKFLDKFDYTCSFKYQSCYGLNEDNKMMFYDYSHHTNDGIKHFSKIISQINYTIQNILDLKDKIEFNMRNKQ